MGKCGDCKHWNTYGFGLRIATTGSEQVASVGNCELVALSWYPPEEDKMIALNNTEYAGAARQLIKVITRRNFGCNQFTPSEPSS